jgi:LacI family transcriptional regulator
MSSPTYRDLAKMAGVSVATVSFAMRNRPGVSPEVRERIRALAKKTGYKPNPLVTALMVNHRKKSGASIRAVIAFMTHEDLSEPEKLHFTVKEYLRGIREACQEQGFLLRIFHWSDFKENSRKLYVALRTQRIPGVIFDISHEGGIPEWSVAGWENYAIVAIGNRGKNISCDYATSDHYRNCLIVLNELHRRGYDHIGIALLHSLIREQDLRPLSAYLGWKAYTGIRALPPFLTKRWQKEEFLKWFRQHRPQVIIVASHPPIEFLRSEGIRTPEDVGLVHLDIDPRWKEMSGIAQNNFQTGMVAAQVVIDRINRNNFNIPENPEAIFVTGRWIDGATINLKHCPPSGDLG